MINKIFFNKSNWIKIIHVILFIIAGMYILESIFIRGLFSNVILACINIILIIDIFIIAFIKKEYKLIIIDFVTLSITLSKLIYLIYI
ncbi:conserved membrane hypothetical protein [Clostridium neonatale]|nr:conserved membrane hypothetical protein [Clostridium neonatale]